MLIVMSGLPGVGTTTIAREFARSLSVVHVRIDSIEHVLRQAGFVVEGEGYAIAYAVAADNLRVGRTVVADSVNRSSSANVAGGPGPRLPSMGQAAACDRRRTTDCARERAGDHCATATAGAVRLSVIGRRRHLADEPVAKIVQCGEPLQIV
jgi:predicted kinase